MQNIRSGSWELLHSSGCVNLLYVTFNLSSSPSTSVSRVGYMALYCWANILYLEQQTISLAQFPAGVIWATNFDGLVQLYTLNSWVDKNTQSALQILTLGDNSRMTEGSDCFDLIVLCIFGLSHLYCALFSQFCTLHFCHSRSKFTKTYLNEISLKLLVKVTRLCDVWQTWEDFIREKEAAGFSNKCICQSED